MSVMGYLITGALVAYLTVCPVADQGKHQSSVSLAFVREIHRWLLIPARRVSEVEISICWRHHVICIIVVADIQTWAWGNDNE